MERQPRWREAAGLLGAVAAYAALAALGLPCPIRYWTGISCAGCGMTRAWLALLRLDPAAAARFHPLFWLPPLAAALFLARRRLPRAAVRAGYAAMLAAMLGVWLYRLWLPGDGIVTFAPQTGAAVRLARGLWQLLAPAA